MGTEADQPRYHWINGKALMWALGTGRGLMDWMQEGEPEPPEDWREVYERDGHPTLHLIEEIYSSTGGKGDGGS